MDNQPVDENENFNYAFTKACRTFPGLMGHKTKEDFQSNICHLKEHLLRSIDLRLDLPENRLLRQGRNNEPALCIALGMDAKMVELRFKAIQNFEKELRIVGKTHILHSIRHLINGIEVKNGPE
jgi:hypothetical protein